MISISNLEFHFGGRTIYSGANLHIRPKDRIGLIGLNGTGKSTLLRLIDGEYSPDGGSISKAGDCTIGFLNQDLLSYQSDDSILHVAMQAFERALVVQAELEKVLAKMETEYTDALLEKMTKLQEEYEHLDGYTLQARAEEILEGLGFATESLQRPLRTFSGGWRMRVMLAKLLLQKPSLLMLDEPTNHLDLPSIQWLEKYLATYEGAVIMVSHDREFLNNAVNIIVEVSQNKLNYYPGNYEFFLEEKALRSEIQKNAFENQQAQIRQTERFIERFKAKASKARQVQSRVKQLSKLDLIDDVVDENARVHFRFKFSQASGRDVVVLDHVDKAYDANTILKNSNIRLERGDKVALIGANGRGKSTLLRIIGGIEPVQKGEVKVGYNVIPAFYAQHQLESLNVNNEILEELKQAGSAKTEVELRTILGCFLFSNEEVFKKIKVLSGGEKSRVALAKTLISEANFLLLDEPTNHLDMMSVNILIQALDQYEGTYVVISHDRYFVSQIANKIWWIEDHQIKEYPGTYDEWEYWMSQRGETETEAAPKAKAEPKVKSASEDEKEAARKELKKLQQRLAETEQKISEAETYKAQVEEEMARPEVFAQVSKLQGAQSRFAQAQHALEGLMADWESLAQQIEDLTRVVQS